MNNNRLRYLRTSHGITLRSLSEYTGIQFSTIGFLEKGQRPFRQVHIDKLISFFNVTADYLLGRSETGLYVYPQFGDETEPLLFSESEFQKVQSKITPTVMKRPVILSAKFANEIDEDTYTETSYYVYRELKGSVEEYDLSNNIKEKIILSLKKMDQEQLKKLNQFIEDYIL